MLSEFYLDSEDFSEEERAWLSSAFMGLAEGDTPLAVEIIFVDEEEMKRLNREQRGIDRVTDVLSFPALDGIFQLPILAEEWGDELDEEGRIFLGSIVICEKRAREQAEEYGHGYRRELLYLTVHGVLHCLGYDHETESDRAIMRQKEEEVLSKMNCTRD